MSEVEDEGVVDEVEEITGAENPPLDETPDPPADEPGDSDVDAPSEDEEINDLSDLEAAVAEDLASVRTRYEEVVAFMAGNEVLSGEQISIMWERRRLLESSILTLERLLATF